MQEYVAGCEAPDGATVPLSAWLRRNANEPGEEVHEEVRQTTTKSWLALLTGLPDPEDDTGWEERAADAEREQRRSRFSRY